MIKVLVVDDSALMRKLLGQILSDAGEFEVIFARNGEEGLANLASHKPDVVTLDINMPGMSGVECLDRIMLQHPTPVIMLSSLTESGANVTLEALRLGAVDALAKPSGALSLGIEEMSAGLVEKIRAAATARLPATRRLTDRVRHLANAGEARGVATPQKRHVSQRTRASGSGLVVIGSSTGGPPALEAVLTGLPAEFPWPILISQHMPALFTAALARRLDRQCALRVIEVAINERLEAGGVYIARGDADVVVSKRGNQLEASSVAPLEGYLWRPSVDRMVRTSMECLPASQIIGVMLTGMGSDGSAAMASLRQAGGRTIAESQETAVVWGMPGELAKAGGADWVAPIQDVAQLIINAAPPCP